MSESASDTPVPGPARTLLCLAWVLAVSGAYAVTYSRALIRFAEGAAARLPVLEPLLHWLKLGP